MKISMPSGQFASRHDYGNGNDHGEQLNALPMRDAIVRRELAFCGAE
ncbi:MAG: hypothetical protein IPN33_26585 [Saprospiraceae bacterium]|nr:hypothetical protein [Saprospiraceae bacterium]